MKTLILKIALALMGALAGAAHAQEAPAIYGECLRQMLAGSCTVQNAPSVPMVITGMGQISVQAQADYYSLRDPNDPFNPAMCQLALTKVAAEPAGDHAKLARAWWTPIEPTRHAQPQAAAQLAAATVAGTLLCIALAGAVALRGALPHRTTRNS